MLANAIYGIDSNTTMPLFNPEPTFLVLSFLSELSTLCLHIGHCALVDTLRQVKSKTISEM